MVAQANVEAALKHYRAKNDIIRRLVKADPANTIGDEFAEHQAVTRR